MSALFTKIAWASALFTAAVALGTAGCKTEAFCFADCDGTASTGTGTGGNSMTTGSGGGSGGGCVFNCTTTSSGSTGGGDGGVCTLSNGGIEICDGMDNDCNGKVDDIPNIDYTEAKTCGTCSNSCYAIAGSNWDNNTIVCDPGASPGSAPGTCSGKCATDYFDLNNDGLCEYYCVKSANDDKTCNNKDDDCDGVVDEDVDVCTSTTDCGGCGHNCALPHATPVCVHTGSAACDPSNTQCQIQACDCNGPTDCWHDLDKSAATGCEYPCFPTGPEVCGDGIDNDCDGLIDEQDDLSQDPQIGKPCQGGTKGVCADPAHAGTTKCVSHQVVCDGPNVVKPNEKPETCNTVDDDCDGLVDNNLTDVGIGCEGGMFFPCQKGTTQCQNGVKLCVGAVNPLPETCDGVDNDCDGVIDNNLPAAQNGAPCSVPVPPPAGATSPCQAGTTKCSGGALVCMNAKGPTGPTDGCKVDANCDGALTNQPNLMTDVKNCGMCGNDCTNGAVHANWACVTGQCVFQGCQQGFYDNGGPGDAVAGDNKCGYPCTFASAQETCNAKDDNCDGQIDEAAALVPPAVTQVCGVSPGATAPECGTYNAATNPGGVSLACVNGNWACTFHTAQVCNPTCAAATEVCDTLDNNCNGLKNETSPNFGQPCASDDNQPAPGHGACRTTGTFQCDPMNGPTATKCGAAKDPTKATAELCDGVDNDCDGLVDETFNDKGTNPTFFVKPAVTKISSNPPLWIYSYEASRAAATTVVPGSGNGYWCSGASCATGIPSAPANVTLDKTRSCSTQGKIPWFNVTATEADQTCSAVGGHVCTTAEWKAACITSPVSATTCKWGYAPNGAPCTAALGGATTGTAYPAPTFPTTGAKFCNLGPTYDFAMATGDQDGLLVTGSGSLQNCYADWTLLLSNGTANGKIFDITGNLRELTKTCNGDGVTCTMGSECCSTKCVGGTCGCKGATTACTGNADCCSNVCTANKCVGGTAGVTPSSYPAMGGAFDTQDETGAECGFDFYSVDQNFQLYDLGFRCCFSADPTQ